MQAVTEHAVVDAVAESVKSSQSEKQSGNDESLSGTLSFFRGRAKKDAAARSKPKAAKDGGESAGLGAIGENE